MEALLRQEFIRAGSPGITRIRFANMRSTFHCMRFIHWNIVDDL